MAGGGSALTLPALIFIGLDSATANGSNRLALIIQNIFAVESFRQNKFFALRQSLLFAAVTVPGAILGSLAAVRISDAVFQKILGLVMIGIVLSLFFSPIRQNGQRKGKKSFWVFPALFGIGFYGGFIQVGVGFIIMAALYHLARLDLVRVNMHKVFIILIYTLPALLVFAFNGHVHWWYGLALAAGNSNGAWWGAKTAVKGGEKIIRLVLSVAILLMAAKLFNLY